MKGEKTTELLLTLYKLDFNPLPQLKLALIKTAQSELIQYIIEDKSETKDEDLLKAYYGSCFIHLQEDTYVAAKEYRGQIYIHIRNYTKRDDQQRIPTKQGVGLTFSRWLILESKRDEVDKLFKQSLNGKLEQEEWMLHLGGGIQITISEKFPTVDIRQFWQPKASDKARATKRGISLNKFKWERLCDVMDIIREFLPEIEQAEICYETHANELELTSCRECYPFDQDDVEGDEKDEVSLNQEGSLDIMKKMLM
ncbi:unnamed protein product [Mytilus coruscus]|uniref:Transcriptional coactivator p15 (PC4) C-terminal domain-containing protein n=1 Tax=Mytilus coruscus TaxID=42192 RepID=A0A6J8A1R2_MYTCO|nr:unnamed protein product [Mytilus coruscus]